MKEITVAELKSTLDAKDDLQVIDVREPHEYEAANIGGKLIPLSTLEANAAQVERNKPVVIHCKSGMRSAAAVDLLERKFGYTNVMNLKGGILAWAREVDPTLQVV